MQSGRGRGTVRACSRYPPVTSATLPLGSSLRGLGFLVHRLVAALNVNDTLLRHLETGAASSRATRRTLSSAMDVSDPSNLERLASLTGARLDELRRWIWSASFDDRGYDGVPWLAVTASAAT